MRQERKADAHASQELVARFYDAVLNQKQLEMIPELVAADFVEHGTPPVSGIEGFRSFLRSILDAFPDLRFTVDDWIVEGDRVVARCSAAGTHLGELFEMAPTGHPVSWTAIHIWRIADGRLAERWSEANVLALMEQLKQR